ncbi:hypothetical protein STENM223S_04859 [Streptomyces tendae]
MQFCVDSFTMRRLPYWSLVTRYSSRVQRTFPLPSSEHMAVFSTLTACTAPAPIKAKPPRIPATAATNFFTMITYPYFSWLAPRRTEPFIRLGAVTALEAGQAWSGHVGLDTQTCPVTR